MKILIIAIPRSGSTTLLKTISSMLKLKRMGEPFNEGFARNVNWNYKPENNVVVKSLINIIVPNHNTINFYKEYSKLFDKTIILSRKNTQEAAESYAFQMWTPTNIPNKWHHKYNYNHLGDIDKWVEFMIKNTSDLEILSKELNIEIDWYEDLYSGKKEEIVRFVNKHKIDINLDKFSEYLNPKHRLRQFDKTIKNII